MANEELQQKTVARNEIILKGRSLPGISPNVDPKKSPVWYDPVAFQHAQKLWKTYGVIIRISQLYGLNLVLYHEGGLVPLLVTGKSETIPKLFNRYLSTGIHVANWFESDPFDPASKSYRSLKTVRGLHRQVGTKMNSDIEQIQPGQLWINQSSMCHAQFSFIGMMAIFPIELGFHNFTPKDFHAMFHFWRVIGYCLGIDDPYNLCDGSDEEIVELCRHIYYKEWLPVIEQGGVATGVEMSKGICAAMSQINPNVNFNALMRYASPFMGLNQDNYQLQNFNEKFRYYMLVTLFKVMTRSKFINWCLGKVSDIRLQRTITNKSKLHEELVTRYPDTRYTTNRCPFELKINYADAFDMNLVN